MDNEAARQQMIDQQVRAWEVLDPRVLTALGEVPRESFVPAAFRQLAFMDAPIPLPGGQAMLPPSIHGRILQAVDVAAGETVLEIGSGSGYLAACLAALGAQVTSLEIRPELAALSAANLAATGHTDVNVVETDATTWTPTGQYDVVVLTASLPDYDRRYESWLKIGGRLFVVVGDHAPMTALLVRRAGEQDFGRTELFETVIDPLSHAHRPSGFVF